MDAFGNSTLGIVKSTKTVLILSAISELIESANKHRLKASLKCRIIETLTRVKLQSFKQRGS